MGPKSNFPGTAYPAPSGQPVKAVLIGYLFLEKIMKYLLGFLCVISILISGNMYEGQTGQKPGKTNPLDPAAKAPLAKPLAFRVAAKTPEELLPANAVAFFRYDGYEPHRQAYDKSTLGELMKDDLGVFLRYLGEFSRDQILKNLDKEGNEDKPGLMGMPQGKVREDIDKFMEYFWGHGFAVSVEVAAIPFEIPGRFSFPVPTPTPTVPAPPVTFGSGPAYNAPASSPASEPNVSVVPLGPPVWDPPPYMPPAEKPKKKEGDQPKTLPVPAPPAQPSGSAGALQLPQNTNKSDPPTKEIPDSPAARAAAAALAEAEGQAPSSPAPKPSPLPRSVFAAGSDVVVKPAPKPSPAPPSGFAAGSDVVREAGTETVSAPALRVCGWFRSA